MAERYCVNCGHLWAGVGHRMKYCSEDACQQVMVREKGRRYREAHREKLAKRDIERNRRYRESNREKVAEKSRRYYMENREKVAERSRRWRLRNPGKAAETKRHWRGANPEIVADQYRRSRERKAQKWEQMVNEIQETMS